MWFKLKRSSAGLSGSGPSRWAVNFAFVCYGIDRIWPHLLDVVMRALEVLT